MIKRIACAATSKALAHMSGLKGLNSQLAGMALEPGAQLAAFSAARILPQNAGADLVEQRIGAQYPAVQIYCERIVNDFKEKFRAFSGKVRMIVEVRHSQDRLDGLEDKIEAYADAVSQVLDQARGDWGDGMYYGGGYEVSFGAVKRGGKAFVQAAKITFEIGVSRN